MVRRVTSPVLVGRSEVVAQLEEAVSSAAAGRPRHAVIGGEAGVGKTRLLAELRSRAEATGARVLLGGCVALGSEGLPFAPYTEIIRSLVAQDGAAAVVAAAGRAAADLARLVPALDTGEPAPGQEMWAQTRMYEALLDLFGRLAGRSPLVIGLEDLHWADAGTLAATSFLLRAFDDEPVAIVATFRADEITRRHPLRTWLAQVVRDAAVERIELEPLDRDGVAELVTNILGQPPTDRALDAINARADGNPFFVEELLCCRSEYDEAMPASLRDVLLSRIDALPDSAQRLLGVAAVGGREVEHDMLMAVAGEAGGDEGAALGALVETGLLLPLRAADGDDAYSFRHALLREVVYEEMLPTERRRLHRRWAEYLLEHERDRDAARLVQLAHHWREARDERALAASIAAGDRAMASFSYEVAAAEFGEALLLWDDVAAADRAVDHVGLLERSARSSLLAADFRAAVAACREALEELGDGDPARRTGLLVMLARTQWVSGDWGTATGTYELALETAPAVPPSVRLRALAGLAQAYMLDGRYLDARPLCEEAIEGAQAIGARDLEGHGRNTLAVVVGSLGQTEAGLMLIEEARSIALELGIPDDIGRAYVNKVDIETMAGHPELALETALEGMRVAAEWGVASSYGAYIGYGGVTAAFELGQWDVALGLLARADRVLGSMTSTFIYRASYIAELCACTGDERFGPMWDQAWRLLLEQPPSDPGGPLFQGGIEHAALGGDHALAATYTAHATKVLRVVHAGYRVAELARVAAWPLIELARDARRSGEVEGSASARERLEELRSLAEERSEQLQASGRIADIIALDLEEVALQLQRLDGDESAGRWRAVAEGWARLGRPYRAAKAHWHEARAAETTGQRDEAVGALREAYVIATDLGAKPLLHNLETMARRLRVRLGGTLTASAAPERAYGLTRREQEVLAEVAAGRTNREIAAALFISESTAGVHVSNILGKLGVSTRTEAARLALDQGLLGDDS